MLIPLKTDSPLRSVPWGNWVLIAINVIVFLAQSALPEEYFTRFYLDASSPKVYQFITYAFLHGGWLHIGGNMLFLYIFGNNICDRLGNFAYVAFYLAGAVFAGVGYSLLSQGEVLGASGAVAAVTGAYLALLPRSHVKVVFWFILIGLYDIPSVWFIILFFVLDVVMNIAGADNVAHLAHISGSIFGFMLCMVLLKSGLLPRDHFDMLALVDRWNRRRQYQSVVRDGYDPFNYTQPARNSAPPPLPVLGQFDHLQEKRAQVAEEIARGRISQAAAAYLELRRMDPNQTLSRGSQLDVANYFYAQQDYQNAAEAYELFLKSYRQTEQAGQVYLMLGLVYGRYLNQPDLARENLLEAVRMLHSDRELELAKAELLRLQGAA